MRRAPIPHSTCGIAPVCGRRKGGLRYAHALALVVSALLLASLISPPSSAQDPSQVVKKTDQNKKGGTDVMFGPAPKIDRAQPLYMQADQLIYDTKNNRIVAQGNVEIYYNNFILTADQVIYDQNVNKLIAQGNAQLKDPNGSITRADRFEALDDFRDAFIQSLSMVTRDDTRIAAARASRREGNVTEYERGKFTPCKNDPGMPPLWCISATRIIHDQRAATLTYQDANFELFGVPIMYMPYFQHPDPSVKRRSGFLTPSVMHSSTLGWGSEVPYYIALAPNYDLTFNPQYWSLHGTLWQGEWRHRLVDGQYFVKFQAIDESEADTRRANTTRDWAGSIETKGQFSLSSWWRYGWDITVESDDAFRRFYKLDGINHTERVNTVYLEGMSERNYLGAKLHHLGGLLLTDTPYANSLVHPVVDYNYIVGAPILGGELSFTGHARNMSRSDGTDTTHAVVEASWRRKLIDPIGQVWTPFGNARGDVYSYTDARDPDTLLPIPGDTVARGIAASGLLYSYPFVAHTAFASHTIAPTAQIIVRQNQIDQRRLPDEDAKSLLYDDTLLFDIDKFSGYDRFETGTRANVGVQYTFQTSGGVYGRAVFGQSLHLAGENPYVDPGLDPTANFNYSPASGLETNRSDYVAGLYLAPFTGISLVAQARFDELDWSIRRQDTILQAEYGPITGTLAYSYSQYDPLISALDTQQDVIGSLGLRLTNHWKVSGAVRYDIDAQLRIQDVFSLIYSDECFVLTASLQETFTENPLLDIKPDRTVMLRFEFKHLGTLNYSTSQLDQAMGERNNGSLLPQ